MSLTASFVVRTGSKGKDVKVHVCFRDSYQVLCESLSDLVKQAGIPLLKQTSKMKGIYNVSDNVIYSKGVFPYSFFDSYDKMNYANLPPIESFFDTLTQSRISLDDYDRARSHVSSTVRTLGLTC